MKTPKTESNSFLMTTGEWNQSSRAPNGNRNEASSISNVTSPSPICGIRSQVKTILQYLRYGLINIQNRSERESDPKKETDLVDWTRSLIALKDSSGTSAIFRKLASETLEKNQYRILKEEDFDNFKTFAHLITGLQAYEIFERDNPELSKETQGYSFENKIEYMMDHFKQYQK